ncbi:MAG: hypothetical protein ABR555_05570 [Pyrinomonadaceae bacterium]
MIVIYRISPTLIFLSALFVLISPWVLPLSHAQGQVQVTAANPASAEQGTVNLNVRVLGKGFKNGAKTNWFVTGTTDPGGVRVNSTTFVSSTELNANITVPDGATIASYDIQVLNSDGRGGKGTELFAVTAKGNQTSCGTDITNLSISIYKYTDATNTTTYNMWPDMTYADGSPVPYVSGETKGRNHQSIDGRFEIGNCSYDLTLGLSSRYFTWKFPAGSVAASLVGSSVNSSGFNIDRVGSVPVTDGGANFLTWCNGGSGSDNYGGCGVDGDGYFARRAMGSAFLNYSYGNRYNYSTIDNIETVAAGTAYVKIYHPNVNTWIIMPDQVQPPPGVTDPNATVGQWSILLDRTTNPDSVAGYQKMPFKMVVTRF